MMTDDLKDLSCGCGSMLHITEMSLQLCDFITDVHRSNKSFCKFSARFCEMIFMKPFVCLRPKHVQQTGSNLL